VRLLHHVGNTHRARFSKEDTENPVVAREVADASSRRVVDPCRDKAVEVRPGPVEDSERPVARSDEACRHLHGLVEDIVQRSLGADRDIRLDKVSEAPLSVSDSGHGHLAVTVSHGARRVDRAAPFCPTESARSGLQVSKRAA
jgi:hypothetical protein